MLTAGWRWEGPDNIVGCEKHSFWADGKIARPRLLANGNSWTVGRPVISQQSCRPSGDTSSLLPASLTGARSWHLRYSVHDACMLSTILLTAAAVDLRLTILHEYLRPIVRTP